MAAFRGVRPVRRLFSMSTTAHYYKLREQRGDRKIHEWVIKVVEDEDGAVFDPYVGLDRHGRVVERSSAYGVFEGNAEGFQDDSGASLVGRTSSVARGVHLARRSLGRGAGSDGSAGGTTSTTGCRRCEHLPWRVDEVDQVLEDGLRLWLARCSMGNGSDQASLCVLFRGILGGCYALDERDLAGQVGLAVKPVRLG